MIAEYYSDKIYNVKIKFVLDNRIDLETNRVGIIGLFFFQYAFKPFDGLAIVIDPDDAPGRTWTFNPPGTILLYDGCIDVDALRRNSELIDFPGFRKNDHFGSFEIDIRLEAAAIEIIPEIIKVVNIIESEIAGNPRRFTLRTTGCDDLIADLFFTGRVLPESQEREQ
jgi:hypothetical protein